MTRWDGSIPADFVASITPRPADDRLTAGGVDGETWLTRVPGLIEEALRRWSLAPVPEVAAMFGQCALVVPVLRQDGARAALKLTWPHLDAQHEARMLTHWGGVHAVRLLAADPRQWTLLLEWLEPTDLMSVSTLEQAEVLGGLARALDRPAPPWAPRWVEGLTHLIDRIDRLLDSPGAVAFPQRFLVQARAVALQHSAADPETDRLVHSDLHQYNVLRRPNGADAASWVAIDPKPVAGHPALGAAPFLWNAQDRTLAADDRRRHLELRLAVWCEAAGVDPDLARGISLVRVVSLAISTLEQSAGPVPDFRNVGALVVLCKALLPG